MGQDSYVQLMEGRTANPFKVLLRGLLWLVSLCYRLLIGIRNAAFDLGLRRSQRVSIPVISVGNITTGGTGKTPFVALVTEVLQSLGMRPGILSRGYGADASGENDEKRVLNRLIPGVPHLQNPSRIQSAWTLIQSNAADCLVMDDGYQHRMLSRDLDVVLIDACNPFGFGELLPRGLLREPLTGLRRANVILITRCDLVTEQELAAIEDRIYSAGGHGRERVFRTWFKPVGLVSADGRVRALPVDGESRCWLMSGIGNPAAFAATCRKAGLHLLGQSTFRDHHLYSPDELNTVLETARSQDADFVVTTLKDLVKIPESMVDIWAIDIRPGFVKAEDEAAFRQLIQQAVARKLNETDCPRP